MNPFEDPKVLTVLITQPPIPTFEATILETYGFSIEFYISLILEHITIGYDESLYNVIYSECLDYDIPDAIAASVVNCCEIVGRSLLDYIVARRSLHLLLVCDIHNVEFDTNNNWIIECSFNESKYELARNTKGFSLPNMQHSDHTSYMSSPHISTIQR